MTRTVTAAAASVKVDAKREVEWNLLPDKRLNSASALSGGFQFRWDAQNLYMIAEIADTAKDATDSVEVFVDDNNGKTPTYEADDAAYRVQRNGARASTLRAQAANVDGGYRIEAATPPDCPMSTHLEGECVSSFVGD